jgi:DNA-binding response OmpR family regulator
MSSPQVLVVDNEADFVRSLYHTLVHEGYEVLSAENGTEALRLANHVMPDLIILGVMLPDITGNQVCKTLRCNQHMAAIPILMLSWRNSTQDRINGLNDGADDYLAKPFDAGELKARIAALLRRTKHARRIVQPSASRLSYQNLSLDLFSHKVMVGNRAVALTPAEFDLLRHLLAHQGHVFSCEQLLDQVWQDKGADRDLGLVRWHVMKLRSKIEPNPSQPIYVRTMPRHGYVLGET